jgi:hypothetical protein
MLIAMLGQVSVPEPPIFALMALGSVLMLVRRRTPDKREWR